MKTKTAKTTIPAIVSTTPKLDALVPLPVSALRPSKWNPRRNVDAADIKALADSMTANGQFTPLIVRPMNGDGTYEIGAGHRRFAAAQLAGIDLLACEVRALDDDAFTTLLALENLDRVDLHPLDEGDAYADTMTRTGDTIAQLAARLHKPLTYIYDRVRFRQLTAAARQLFADGEITISHAILLSRLSTDAQKRAIAEGLFRDVHEAQITLEGVHDRGKRQAKTPRELSAWIKANVRFNEHDDVAPVLFPETVAQVQTATEAKAKVVHLTFEHYVRPGARDEKERTIGPRSFKECHGKPCEHQVIGVVVVGERQGEAFPVCIAKDKCKTHWGKELADKSKIAKQGAAKGEKVEDTWKAQQAAADARRAKEDAQRARFKKAWPTLRVAIAKAVNGMKVDAKSPLADYIAKQFTRRGVGIADRGKTAEDFVRAMALCLLTEEADNWSAFTTFPPLAKSLLKLDVKSIVDKAAPAPKDDATSDTPKADAPKAKKTK